MSDQSNFASLEGLKPAAVANLSRLGYNQMTAIQEQALPVALAGRDVIAQAKTGSGKTATFGLVLLEKLNPRFFGVQSLVLCPTRELSTQVANELRRLAQYQSNIKIVVLCGGVAIGPQIGSLEHGAHVVVGTPGRIKDHLRKKTLTIDQVKTLVLDEADRMLDMGFSDDILQIISETPSDRQTLLFSATYPDNIHKLSDELQHNPEFIKVDSVHQLSTIQQHHIMCDNHTRTQTLLRSMAHFGIQQAVIFCNTKQSVEQVNDALREQGYLSLALHGDLDQRERDQVYIQFKQNSAHCLVATDIAARGLDVDDLQAVVNYELPRDPEVYVHRIGRTGRAGKEGLAISLVSEREDRKRDSVIQQVGHDIPMMVADEFGNAGLELQSPPFVTLCFAEGRKNKLRPGDIVGAITSSGEISNAAIGNITVLDFVAYAAVERELANQTLRRLEKSRIKGRKIKVRRI
ncbi:MAG: ATP-dependent RNA helicase DbpA [Reinekea sp.]